MTQIDLAGDQADVIATRRLKWDDVGKELLQTLRHVHVPDVQVEAIREVTQDDPSDHWHRIPLFLHLRAIRP